MMDFLTQWAPHLVEMFPQFVDSIVQTLIMIVVVGSISLIFGVIFGVILVVTREGDIMENKIVYTVLGKIIDLFRAIPFVILIMVLGDVTKLVSGTSIGLKGSFFPLIVGTIPFFARQIESVLADIDHGLIEASQAMGFSPREIIFSVYLRESIPGITRVTMITFVSLVGITAIAGAIGAGGLGDFAIRYGYQMGYRDMIWLTVIIILLIISVFQFFGNIIIKKSTH